MAEWGEFKFYKTPMTKEWHLLGSKAYKTVLMLLQGLITKISMAWNYKFLSPKVNFDFDLS